MIKRPGKFFTTIVLPLACTLLLCSESKAQESSPRRNAAVIAVEKVGPAVANLSTEKLLVERDVGTLFGSRNDFFTNSLESLRADVWNSCLDREWSLMTVDIL